jgi:hypothetical protein
VLENFCQLTVKHLEKGTAAKAYSNAARKKTIMFLNWNKFVNDLNSDPHFLLDSLLNLFLNNRLSIGNRLDTHRCNAIWFLSDN